MGRNNSYPVLTTDWRELLEAVAAASPDVQASIETEQQILAQALAEVLALRARQAQLTAQKQASTQQLKASKAKGSEAAIVVRSILRGKVGPHNEELVHFKVAPIRKRKRKTEKEAGGETSGAKPVKPDTAGSPSVKPAD
jgi:cell pole-organizing protein PopZ